MAEFIGRADHSLDAKGRVILPSKYRSHFDRGGVLSKNEGGCLALRTHEKFSEETDKMLKRAASGPRGRDLMRVWAEGSEEVEIDRQGRIPIPGRLRTFALLQGDVVVTGAIDHMEFWNPERYVERMHQAELELLQGQGPEEEVQQG